MEDTPHVNLAHPRLAQRTCINHGPHSSAHMVTCRVCGYAKAAEEFRRRHTAKDARLRECRSCHAESERLRRRAKRSHAHRKEVNRDLARLKRARSARQLALVCESMIRGFGGPEDFARAWTSCLRRDLNRGGFAALRHIEATIRLIQHCEAARPDYRSMSDEELLDLASKLAQDQSKP
jgi:hypothetical protein